MVGRFFWNIDVMKLYYLYDPLCGWCYGAKPVLSKLAQHYPIALTPTGLFCQTNRTFTPEFIHHAWTNDQRIGQLTGVIYSQAYKENVLKVGNAFDSYHSLLAITATENIAPHRAVEVLSALQMARYVDGRDNQDFTVITDVLNTLGLGEVIEHITHEKTDKTLQENIHFGQSLAKRLNIQGVPQLVIEHDGQWLIVPSQALYGDGETLLEYLAQFD